MEITIIYFISQIITIIYYALLNLSYLVKDRNKILKANFVAHIGQTIAMALLKGYTGAAMAVVMLFRDLILLVQANKQNKEKENNRKIDLLILIVTIILILILTAFTYNGPLSLLSVIATLILTLAIWQKDVRKYRFMGIIAGILWMLYNIFIFSIMGIILETTVVISAIIGYLKTKLSKE